MTEKIIAITLTVCMFIMGAGSQYLCPTNSNTISDNTVITASNIEEVVTYLGLSADSILENDSDEDYGDVTVGELRNAISTANTQTITGFDLTGNLADVSTMESTSNATASRTASKSKVLSVSYDIDSYTIDVDVTAQYSGSKWTGVGGISASVDSDNLVITYKIASKSLSTSYTSSVVKLSGSVSVNAYIGIGSLGLIKVGSAQKTTITANFYAKNYL